MTQKIAILVETPRTGAGMDFVKACRRNDIEPVLFIAKPDEQPAWVMDDYYAEGVAVRQVNSYDANELLAACWQLANEREVVAVLSLYEYSVVHAAEVAKALGLCTPNPAVVRLVRDKSQFRQFISEHSIETTRFLSIDLNSNVKTVWPHSYPAVVKPVNLTGSAFVRHCRNEEELQAALQEISSLGEYTGQSVEPRVLIEEYIEGNEFSVEVLNGKVVAIVRKYTTNYPGFIEVGHDLPAGIVTDVLQQITDTVLLFLQEVGYTFGLMHIELKVNESGVQFIEANPRVAGGRIPELIRRTYGVDMIEEYLLSLLGKTTTINAPHNGEFASIRFIVAKADGVIEGYRNVALDEHPLITEYKFYKNIGEPYQINYSNRDRIVHAVAVSESIEQNEAAIVEFFRELQIKEVTK